MHLLDDCDLSQVPSSAALYQRDVRCQTHPVHMVTGRCGDTKCFIFFIISTCWQSGVLRSREYYTSVIQSIHHQHELPEELHVVVRAVRGEQKTTRLFPKQKDDHQPNTHRQLHFFYRVYAVIKTL